MVPPSRNRPFFIRAAALATLAGILPLSVSLRDITAALDSLPRHDPLVANLTALRTRIESQDPGDRAHGSRVRAAA
jgi:hypothetical protein